MKSLGFVGSIARAATLCAVLIVNAHAGPGDWSGQGPFGGSVVALQADPLVATRVYASTTNGFFRSDDAGVSWAAAETGLLVAHPANGVFTVSPSVAGGLWMFDDAGRLYGSSDGGNNWIPTGYLSGALLASGFNSVAQGSASTVWYAANTGGLLVSTNNGATFAAAGGVGLPAGQTFTLVATNPHNTQQVIASSASSCNAVTGICPVYISNNGGANWSASAFSGVTSVASGTQRITAIAFGPGTNVYALFGDTNLSGTALLSSPDNGANWTAHTQFGSSLAASPVDPLTVWVDANKSTNGGGLFTPLATAGRNTNGAFVPGTSAIAVSANYPSTPRLWIGTYFAGMYLSNNDGATWASSSDGMAATNIRSVIVHPADNTRLFAGYGDSIGNPSQAFFRSTSSGTWSVSNAGLNAWQLRTVLIDPTTAGTIGSTVMFGVGSGFDTSPPSGGNRNSGIYKSLDGGLTWATQNGGIPASPPPAGPGHFAGNLRTIIADPRSCVSPPLDGSACTTGPLRTLYVTGGGRLGTDPAPGTGTHAIPRLYRVMKSTDGGANWADSSTGLPPDMVSDLDCTLDSVQGVTPIVMDPSNSNILYIGTFAGASDALCNNVTPQVASGVYKSINGGASWTLASTGLPTYTGSSAVLDTLSLAIDAGNPNTLWVSTIDNGFSPAAPGQIYKTTNGGANWTISNAGVTGPDVRALLADPSTPGTIYAASGGLGPANPGGVYKSTDGGANWMSISVGLPSFSATALTLDPVDPSVLYAGTSGGVYSIVQLPDSDSDGVPDLVENSGPNGGDANHDNAQDSAKSYVGTTAPGLFGSIGWQAGTTNATPAARMAQLQQKLQSLNTPQTQVGIQGGYFTVQVGGGCAQAVDVAPISPGPLGLDKVAHHGTFTYPRGLLRFELPQCAAATVDISFNAATFGPGWSWRYYGPSTPGDNTSMGWHNATTLVASQVGNDWKINLANGSFGSYRPAITNSILFEGGPAYNDTVFSDNFQ